MNKILNEINRFIESYRDGSTSIYNESSLQHELAHWIKVHLNEYKVEFERNVSYYFQNLDNINWTKREIDLVLSTRERKYAIELKNPKNGQVPEQMYSFIKDIKFVEQLVDNGFDGGITLVIVDDRNFYSGNTHPLKPSNDVYEVFRNNRTLKGEIQQPTRARNNIKRIKLRGSYDIKWKSINCVEKYFMTTIL